MNKIQQMVHDLCPNGVEWKTLGEVLELHTGEQLNKSSMFESGKYPVINGGISPSGYIDEYNEEADTITISQGGASAGYVNFMSVPFWAGAHCFVIIPNERYVNKRYLYHFLTEKQKELQKSQQGAGIPSIHRDTIKKIPIPIPPLSIQAEIVNLLDKFTQLSAELKAELKLRRKQYDYYRNHLLSFDSNSTTVQWMPLGEVGTFSKGHGILKSDFVETGFPCIHYGQVHTIFNTYTYTNKSYISEELAAKCRKAHKGDLIIASTSEDVDACCKAVAWMGDYDVAVSGDAHIFSHNQNPKYMAYLFQTEMFQKQKRPYAVGAKVVRVKSESMEKFVFPFPPIEEQERIVGILDKFETLVNDLSKGLPAEIALVQKQYEYYRNLLLTFE